MANRSVVFCSGVIVGTSVTWMIVNATSQDWWGVLWMLPMLGLGVVLRIIAERDNRPDPPIHLMWNTTDSLWIGKPTPDETLNPNVYYRTRTDPDATWGTLPPP